METDHIVDITYAVSAEEAQGRKRIKNMATGETWWEETIQALPVADLTSTVSDSVVTHAKPVKAHKSPPDIEHFKTKAKKHGA
jgi:hypothetical protein